MTDAELFTSFYIWLAIAVVIILVAAILLILVQRAAQRILDLAIAALGLVQKTREQTDIIWALDGTNSIALEILETAESIKGHGAAVATALHDAEGGR